MATTPDSIHDEPITDTEFAYIADSFGDCDICHSIDEHLITVEDPTNFDGEWQYCHGCFGTLPEHILELYK